MGGVEYANVFKRCIRNMMIWLHQMVCLHLLPFGDVIWLHILIKAMRQWIERGMCLHPKMLLSVGISRGASTAIDVSTRMRNKSCTLTLPLMVMAAYG